MRAELGDEYVEALRKLYTDRIPGQSDLVCYWFEKSRAMIEAGRAKRAGLLATNSIRTGANRTILDRIKATGNIFMAWSDRAWILDGAAVRVSMIGFDTGKETEHQLNGVLVANISPDLKSDIDLTTAYNLEENDGVAFVGVTKKGPFDISSELAEQMLRAPLNPNGRPNSDVIRHWVNAADLVSTARSAWIIDFGVDTEEGKAALYERPFEYVKAHVKPFRDKVRNDKERTHWWLHGRPAPAFRLAVKGLGRYIATPTVAKYRLFVWLDEDILPTHGISAFARNDDYFFGVLHSRLHEIWSIRKGNWMGVGNDPSYTPSTCFETFPFPWLPGHEPSKTAASLRGAPFATKQSLSDETEIASQTAIAMTKERAIAAAARELVQLRDAWLNPPPTPPVDEKDHRHGERVHPSPVEHAFRSTGEGPGMGVKRTLTNLYNARPTWLDNAHRKLDTAVFAAYGWPSDLSDDEVLSRLLALNLERATA